MTWELISHSDQGDEKSSVCAGGAQPTGTKEDRSLPPELKDYRQHLVLAEQKAQEDYDKSLLTLSGGALGISMAFVEKVVGAGPMAAPDPFFFSWLSWATSLAFILLSYFLSRYALRSAIEAVDSGKLYIRKPGGWFARLTEAANALAGILFLVGVVLTAIFVVRNLGR